MTDNYTSEDLQKSRMKIRFKKLHEDGEDPRQNAELPSYAKDGDAGLDLKATSIIFEDDERIFFGTGLAVEIPRGFEGQVRPRSNISKTNLILANSPGTVDSGYRGEIQVRFQKLRQDGPTYSVGDKVAQLLIKPVPHINPEWAGELSDSERGDTGFGSSGN